MRDMHPSLDAAPRIDPDRKERRDGRISDAIGALFVAGLVVVVLIAIAARCFPAVLSGAVCPARSSYGPAHWVEC
jgi:hypothetical protein